MKRTLTLLILLATTLVACKKEYTCQCTSNSPDQNRTFTIKAKNNDDANKRCDANSNTSTETFCKNWGVLK